jgi:hypothetical protein
MLKVMIDLPESLKPLTFLQDVEDGLTSQSLQTVKRIEMLTRNDPSIAVKVAQEAEELLRSGETLSNAPALLLIADWYRQNGELENALRLCEKVVGRIRNEQTPAKITIQAVAYYIIGLTSSQMLGGSLVALDAYLKMSRLFNTARSYWQRIAGFRQVSRCDEILGWTQTLVAYIGDLRLDSLRAASGTVLVCAWQSSVQEKRYVLAELGLGQSVRLTDIGTQTSNFLAVRSRSRFSARGIRIDGYRIRADLRMLGETGVIRPFTLRVGNPNALFGPEIIMPAGALYYAVQVDDEIALPTMDLHQGDYLLACESPGPLPDSLALFKHKDDGAPRIIGTFTRDQAGSLHIQEVLRPVRFIGESEADFEYLGNVDFILRPM